VSNHKEPAFLLDKGEPVTFHTAFRDGKSTTFYSRLTQWAWITASKLGIEYDFMRNATREEITTAIEASKLKVLAEVEA
jgi:hypothetical protein